MKITPRAEITLFQSSNSFLLKLFHLNAHEHKNFLRLILKQKTLGLFVGNYADVTNKPKASIGYDVRSGTKEKTEELFRLIETFCTKFSLPLQKKFTTTDSQPEEYKQATN